MDDGTPGTPSSPQQFGLRRKVTADPVLVAAAQDGSLAPADWPAALETVISRLDEIFYNVFPAPSIIPPPAPHVLPSSRPEPQPSSQESQTADKENAPPSTPPARPPVPTFERPPDVEPPSSITATGSSHSSHRYPPELIAFLETVKTTLRKGFPSNPPHTIQRLAEIIINPRAHYKFLYQFLRAVDRIVSVTSPSTIFPLPTNNTTGGALPNGIDSDFSKSHNGLGSDESLGGALLTPIPWLRPERTQEDSQSTSTNPSSSEFISEHTSIIDGPNGAGRIETVTVTSGTLSAGPSTPTTGSNTPSSSSNGSTNVTPQAVISTESLRDSGAVTQGELLRQEQEAGVVPVSQTHPTHTNPHSHAHPHHTNILPSNAPSETPPTTHDPNDVPKVEVDPASSTNDDKPAEAATETLGTTKEGEEEIERDERPHARGPETIGMEDLGPQRERVGGGLDIEAAVGRKGEGGVSPELQKLKSPEPEERGVEGEGKEVEMTDADVDAEAAQKGEEGGGDTSGDKDEDIVLADADGLTDKEKEKMDNEGEGKGAAAVDTSAIG